LLAYGRVVATEAITVSLSEEELVRVDDAVAQGTFRDREDAIRVALSTPSATMCFASSRNPT